MSRKERIANILHSALNANLLEIKDMSDNHIGHIGHNGQGESHYAIRISASKLHGLSVIKQHKMIYDLLREELANGLHSISIKII